MFDPWGIVRVGAKSLLELWLLIVFGVMFVLEQCRRWSYGC